MKRALLLVAVAAMVGCSGTPKLADLERERADAAKVRELEEERQTARRQAKLEKRLASVPAWVMDVPKPDAEGVYAVGTGQSDTLNVAMKKSTLDGEFGLAKMLRQELSGTERLYEADRNNRSTASQFTSVIDKLVARVPVVGYEVLKSEVKTVDGVYASWVLLKLPYDSVNRVLTQQRAEAADAGVGAAFDDLERRVKARQDQRMAEAREGQRMRLEELRVRQSMVNAGTAAGKGPGDVTVPSTVEAKE